MHTPCFGEIRLVEFRAKQKVVFNQSCSVQRWPLNKLLQSFGSSRGPGLVPAAVGSPQTGPRSAVSEGNEGWRFINKLTARWRARTLRSLWTDLWALDAADVVLRPGSGEHSDRRTAFPAGRGGFSLYLRLSGTVRCLYHSTEKVFKAAGRRRNA